VKRFLPVLLLAVAVLGVYAPAVRNGFVWDDAALVLRDPLIRSWRLIPEGFQHFLFTDATASDFYRPIQRLTYTLEYAAFGLVPAPYHITSIVCHLLAAVALLFFARELLRAFGVAQKTRDWFSILATLVWAIHPLQTSAVAYISGRADSLAAAFGFAGLYLGLVSSRATGRRWWILTGGSAVLFLLSVLSKEAGFVFVAAWLAFLLFQKKWREVLRAGVAVLFVVVIYLSLRVPAAHTPPPAASSLPLLVRPVLVARAIAEYTGLILLPLNLHMDRDVETRPSGFSRESITGAAWRELQTLAGISLLAAFFYWMWRARKRDPAIFFLLVLTSISYLPMSGVFPLNATVAEHWLYLPTAFLFLAAGLSCWRTLQVVPNRPTQARMLTGALALWILFLGGRTFIRTFDWRDPRTFLERTIAQGGDSARMLINLGGLELSEGRLDEAKKHLHAALKKEPDQPFAVINLAAVAVKEDDFKTAHELLERAKDMPIVDAQAYELLTILEGKEKGSANLLRMRLAARTGPPNWAIEKRYVKLLAEAGASEAAMGELRYCLATQWYRAETWQLLSELLSKAGRADEAAAAMTRARRYDVRLSDRL